MCSLRLVVVQMLLLMLATARAHELALPKSKPGCPNKCGELDIPYPFGTEAGCYLNEDSDFLISCNNSKPFWENSNLLVTNITMEGQLQIRTLVSKDCYNEMGKIDSISWNSSLSVGDKATISDAQNKFTIVGCDSYGYIRGKIGDKNYIGGCISWCGSKGDLMDGSCFGSGCCQIDIPKGLKEIEVEAYSFSNHTNVWEFNPCSYAFVIEDSQFRFSSSNLSNMIGEVPTAVDWAITGQGQCEEARNNTRYACKQNSECYEPPADNSAGGYLCRCKDGYEGNPYLSDSNGCQDVDECKNGNYSCNKHAYCVNIQGNYTCKCSNGYNGDGRIVGDGCIPDQLLTKIVVGAGLSLVILLVFSAWLYFMFKKRRLVKLK